MKYYRYAKCMGEGKHPHPNLLIGEFCQVPGTRGELGAEGKLTRGGLDMQVPSAT